jgi:hypothetical protein
MNQERRIDDHEQRHQSSMIHFQDVRLTSAEYLEIRQRFLDVFRRDKLGAYSPGLKSNIALGNERAHGGDAVTDAEIFVRGMRHDIELMKMVYGISANKVLELRESQSH